MSPKLKFEYRRFPAEPSEAYPRRFSAIRPVIPITLINGDDKISCLAIIDSGADLCIFHAEMGEQIRIDIESGKLQNFTGISGQQKTAYFHDIKIEVGGHEFDCFVGFSRDISDMPYEMLGQVGFFSLFNVTLDFCRKKIELGWKGDA